MVTYGNNPGMGIPVTGRVPRPEDALDPRRHAAASSARSSTWASRPGQAIAGQPVDVVFIGSCTNSRISDLRLAASVLKDRRVHEGTRVMIVPGSQQVKAQAEREGLDVIFRAAGAEWREAGCSMCIAMNGDQLSPGQYAVSTSNRNFEGRQGKGGRTFLASPADRGRLGDQRRRHRSPHAARRRGPRHRRRRVLTWPSGFRSFTSRVVPLTAENVDTDQIVPARYLKVTDKEGLADALFRDYRFDEDGTKKDPPFILDRPEMQGRRILLVGDNFGTGSSREHAPWALRSWGIQAILSTSFADIFRSNALKNGVLPIVVDPATHARLFEMIAADADAELRVDLAEQGILLPDGSTLDFDVDPFSKMMLMAGTDEIGYVLAKDAEIAAWEATHPARVDTRLGTRRPADGPGGLVGGTGPSEPSRGRCRLPGMTSKPTVSRSIAGALLC